MDQAVKRSAVYDIITHGVAVAVRAEVARGADPQPHVQARHPMETGLHALLHPIHTRSPRSAGVALCAVADNGTVAMLEGLLIVRITGVLLYLAIRALMSNQAQEPQLASNAGHWRTAHYDVDGDTKVVVQKVTPAGTHVLDEHVIAEIQVSDPTTTNSS